MLRPSPRFQTMAARRDAIAVQAPLYLRPEANEDYRRAFRRESSTRVVRPDAIALRRHGKRAVYRREAHPQPAYAKHIVFVPKGARFSLRPSSGDTRDAHSAPVLLQGFTREGKQGDQRDRCAGYGSDFGAVVFDFGESLHCLRPIRPLTHRRNLSPTTTKPLVLYSQCSSRRCASCLSLRQSR